MRWLLLASLLACGTALAQPGLEQRIGARVPMDIAVADETGAPHRLADFTGDRPVLLVPGAYRCPQLCGLVMYSLLDGLHASGAQPDAVRIVGVSIDPQETAADARQRREVDLAYARTHGSPPDLRLLTLAAGPLQQLSGSLGLRFERAGDALVHPATVVLLTRSGDVARYFNGVGLDAGELRIALADAAGDRIGIVTARLAVLCSQLEPHAGRWNTAVMNAMRALSLLLAAALAGWCWRRRGGVR